MPIQHLGGGEIEILLRDVHPPLPQRIHARLGTHALQLRAGTAIHLLRHLGQIDATGQIHRAGMNAQDIRSSLHGRRGELDLAVNPPRTQQSRVQDIEAIRRHDDLDVLRTLEPVELIE